MASASTGNPASKIGSVKAVPYAIPVSAPLLSRKVLLPFTLVSIELENGLTGHGICGGISYVPASAKYINEVIAPELKGENPLASERIWQLLFSRFNGRGATGFWSSVASAVDIAVWDLKGRILGQSVATLLGGAHSKVPAYITFGLTEYDREQLVEVATQLISEGHTRLKMVVGGLKHIIQGEKRTTFERRRFFPTDIREDARRVRAVREAIGPNIELMIDANCAFTVAEAQSLARLVEDCDLTWFEEPVMVNDFRSLLQLKNKTSIPLATGQHLGHIWAHRELIANGAIDISQPNVCHGGGYSECAKVAALARSYNLPIANGGAWPHHNMHLHAGVPNGGYVEFHWPSWKTGEVAFRNAPTTKNGWVEVPKTPGLGFEPIAAAELAEFQIKE